MAEDPVARFVAVVRGRDEAIPLDEAALLIAAQAHPGLDVVGHLGRLDELASSCGTPTLDGLRAHLFRDLGFRGNRDDYYDPRNSFLDEVMDRRVGIPITLSVLMMEVGRRLGVPLWGVGMPGHFLLRDKVDHSVFVDAFDGGAVLDVAGCARRFRLAEGPGVAFDPSFLEPVPRRAIVDRMLANLEAIYTVNEDREGLAWTLRLKALLPGASDVEARKLAGVLAATGSYRHAATELDRLGELVPGDEAEPFRRSAAMLRAKLN